MNGYGLSKHCLRALLPVRGNFITLNSEVSVPDLPPLSWRQILDACINVARGLLLPSYRGRETVYNSQGYDVKMTNILLDESCVAKMADLELSKDGPALDHTNGSAAVKGTFRYLDPEYFRRQKLTKKSDVYSFGVVLFEIICGSTSLRVLT
ncbi:hypothetical protein IFM89_000758 [Coptis chinensis]|uniref:Protein kinase domain-containing protein n=1 Tax=Coptis chinensis TaxID=261450 RepID=A0A835ITC6_9MAGN|nr:hypothetical protein IFM89_000758 [Coptis chinensis]